MDALHFLRTVFGASCQEYPLVDLRLACSGELYAGRVLTADWTKSDVTRILLREPFELLVVSMPFDAYPQELCLRMPALMTELHGENVHVMRQADEFVCSDLADVFTVIFRRLVRKVGKVAEEHRDGWARQNPSPLNRRPMPSFGSKVVAWKPRPVSLTYTLEGTRAETHHPPPVAVNDLALRALLKGIAEAPEASAAAFLRAARLYALAMELVEERPALSYQLLVATVETAAAVALEGWTPDYADVQQSKERVTSWARDHHLSDDDTRSLVVAAAAGERWVRRKFVKFLVDHAGSSLTDEDALFPFLPESLVPSSEIPLETKLRKIYDARSKATHAGEVFTGYACAGASPQLPRDVFGLKPGPVPPVVWFERVVNIALNAWLKDFAGTSEQLCRTPEENDRWLGVQRFGNVILKDDGPSPPTDRAVDKATVPGTGGDVKPPEAVGEPPVAKQ